MNGNIYTATRKGCADICLVTINDGTVSFIGYVDDNGNDVIATPSAGGHVKKAEIPKEMIFTIHAG